MSQHLDQHLDDTARRIELPILFFFGAGKLGEKILIDAAEDILGAVLLITKADVADEINKLAEALLIKARMGIILGENPLEGGVVSL